MAVVVARSRASAGSQDTARPDVPAAGMPPAAAARPDIGIRFGRLVVESETEPYRWRGRVYRRQWLCACECGAEVVVRDDALRYGHTTSCGCFRDEATRERFTRHGGRANQLRRPEYDIWLAVIRTRPRSLVQPAWRVADGQGFLSFLRDVGPRPSPRHRLVRQDPKAGFRPGNCRWEEAAPRQGVPRRFVTVEGRKFSLRQAAEAFGVAYPLLCKRLQRGWSVKAALDLGDRGAGAMAPEP